MAPVSERFGEGRSRRILPRILVRAAQDTRDQ